MVASNVEHMNCQFAGDLQEPIQFGIGIHGGEVIIGDIGFRDHTVFTALGDAVNRRRPPSGHDEGTELHGRGLARTSARMPALRLTG